jgi:hypothetical protein
MMESQSPSEFGASFKKFMDRMAAAAPRPEPPFRSRFADHLGTAPGALPVVSHTFQSFEHPNLQLAVDALLAEPDTEHQVIGITVPHRGYMAVHLSDLIAETSPWGMTAVEGPVEYSSLDLDDRTLTCINSGVLLIRRGKTRLVCLVQHGGRMARGGINAEVMASDREGAERFLADIRGQMRANNAYRGKVLSLEYDMETGIQVRFHRLPAISRTGIILPGEILDRIERQTIGFSRHAEQLRAAGRHLKRGVLLHGPPGTGKTLTAMYLAGAMPGRTVLLVTGREQRLIEHVCWMARTLEPATIILEDVDLIAEDRERRSAGCAQPLLFELLNQMDGLAEDADLLFVLTTNRPDRIEPALAARPGRIDQAILVPLPDPECRRRLFKLYGEGLDLRLGDPERLIRKTEGASAAFIRELLRKAALFACDDNSGAVVDRHMDEALHELVVAGGGVTKRLLGFEDASIEAESEG